MNLQDLSNEELLARLGEPGTATEVMRRVGTKQIDAAAIEQDARKRNLPAFNEIWKVYQAGELFHAQAYGFLTFLTATEQQIKDDRAAWKNLEDKMNAAVERETVRGRELWAFWVSRIMPSIGDRRALLDTDASLKPMASMNEGQRARFRIWQREYNEATRAWNWRDDTGVAYDERLQP